MMSRLSRWLLVVVLGIGLVSVSVADKLKIATEAFYEPFAYKAADGTLVGFDIDITYALCDVMGAECEIIEQDWDGLIPGLLAKKYDAIIASMSITPKRQKVVDFAGPYYKEPSKFYAKKGAGLVDTPAGLSGKKIGILRATTFEDYLVKHFPNAVIKGYPTQDEVYLDLSAGRVEIGLGAGSAIEKGFLSKEAGKDFEFFGGTHWDDEINGTGTGIPVRKEDTALRDRFNAAIKTLRENGTYKKINDKYFSFDIWGLD
ncbi:MAG TPA: nickel transporter [Gammaproteobacteria bacterium]|nr:nickel transporter [Gammaproteobacteria bacterium]